MYLICTIVLLLFLLLVSTFIDEIRIRKLHRAKQHAEQAATIKSTTLTIMSHEIRNPLTGLLTLTRALNNTALSDSQRHMVNTLDSSGTELLALLNDTLDQSRLEANEIVMHREHYKLSALVQHVINTVETQARQKGLILTTHIDPALPEQLYGDVNRIRQILFNLLGNAIKFTNSGLVKLHVELSTSAGNAHPALVFTVIDSGIGIPANIQDHIFTPFAQGRDIQRRFGGTGVGLSISRDFARAMGGNLTLTSEENRGSTFIFTTPLTVSICETITAPEVKAGLRWLVVDDTDIHRFAAGCLLEAEHHHVTLANCATAALDLLQEQRFDCVLIDIHLPDMDGITFIRTIRAITFPAPIIIALSAWLPDDEWSALLASGADATCQKPLDLSAIHPILAAVTQKPSAGSKIPSTGFPVSGAVVYPRNTSHSALCASGQI